MILTMHILADTISTLFLNKVLKQTEENTARRYKSSISSYIHAVPNFILLSIILLINTRQQLF